jgi:uncharacterized protein (DUF169 family)
MDLKLRDKFLTLWEKYFNNAELPIAFYYTKDPAVDALERPAAGHLCFIGQLARVRKGKPLCFEGDSLGCGGGKKYLGFNPGLPMPNFEYFLSCGIPGEMEGERYVKSPEMVREMMKNLPHFKSPEKFVVFKRWDQLEAGDRPEVVFFFASPDVLSGLFTLANFDEVEPNAVIAPFAAGCASIVLYPYLEIERKQPRAVLGMFDTSARPYVAPDILSFAVPFRKFVSMVDNMEESFLITETWGRIQKRIGPAS